MPPRYSLPPTRPAPSHSPFFRISRALHFGSASFSCQALLCLLPTKQPRAPLMLLLQISGRLLGCLPAGTIGRCVFPSSFRQFFSPLPVLIPLCPPCAPLLLPVSSSCVAPSPPSSRSFSSPFAPPSVPSRIACLLSLVFHPRVYILFYVTLFHYLSHFPGIPVRS